jgi:hypothetical protein
MVTAIMMAGGEEGNGKGINCVRQGTAMATKRVMVTATRVAGSKEGKGGKDGKGKGYSNKGGRQRRGR